MIGWLVETAPPAIIFSSRIRRENACTPRRNRKAVSDMELLLFKHGRRVAGVILAFAVLWIGSRNPSELPWLDEAGGELSNT